MLAHQRREELLILAKTYPHPSTKYRETTCVAALTRAGEMRRLFPVPFRFLVGETRFQKWEWISAVVSKARNDHRPESHKIDVDSIQKLDEVVPTANDWRERLDWARPHLVPSFDELEERRQNTGSTLGFVRPTRLLGLDITPEKHPDWTDAERENLSREVMFDPEVAGRRLPLRKLPFAFHFRYECQTANGSREHRHLLTDWEVGALYWNCVRSDGDNWQAPFRARLEGDFASKDLWFLLGTQHRFPDQWLIISFIYPPRAKPNPQLALSFE